MTVHRRPSRSAYTLVELVMLLAIVAVIAGIAGPRYAGALAAYRATSAARRIAADLNFARVRARTSSLGQSVVFDVNANAYSLSGLAAMSGETGTYTVKLSREPYASKLVSAVFNSSSTLTFDRFGQPSAGGTVSVSSGAYTKQVTIDAATGMAAAP